MNETAAVWVAAIVELILMIGGIVGCYALLVQRITVLETKLGDGPDGQDINKRLVTLEVEFQFWVSAMERLGRIAAKGLHSPDDHLGIDSQLDIFMKHQYALSLAQWQELAHALRNVVRKEGVAAEKVFMAQFLEEIAKHKIVTIENDTTKT